MRTENVKDEKNLKDVWVDSENYKRAKSRGYNYHCPARDGYNIPPRFYKEIKEKVVEYFEKK